MKRSYPLTAVESVEYDETTPLQFQLVFSTYIMTLVAESEKEARDWVEKINGGMSDVNNEGNVLPTNTLCSCSKFGKFE